MSEPRPPIGGEMQIPLEALLSASDSPRDWPFERGHAVTSGRTGLALAAELLDRPGPVLLPSYLCRSVVQPFREAGREVAFYAVGETLEPDVDDLLRRVEEVRPAAAVAIAYFGFPVPSAAAAALESLRGDVLLVEDCVQGSLVESASPPVGGLGDVVVTSFRKYLPVPDGGLVVARAGLALPELSPAPLDGAAGRLVLAKCLRTLVARDGADETLELAALALVESADELLDAVVPRYGPSSLSQRLLAGIDLETGAAARRANYACLLAAFAEEPRLRAAAEPLLPVLPDDVSPLVFPIRVHGGRRDALRGALVRARVFCPVHWPLPAEVGARDFPASARLADEILGLPIDQRYGDAEMASLVARVVEAL